MMLAGSVEISLV